MQPQVIWIGNRFRHEFARITRSIESHAPVTYFANADAIPATLSQPALCCYAWARPGEFESAKTVPFKSRFPTIAHLDILGELCCGMKRTSRKLESATAVYAHELVGDLSVSRLRQLVEPEGPTPVYAERNELVAVYSRSKSYRESIAESLAVLNLKTIRLHPEQVVSTSGVDYVIWDATSGFEPRRDLQTLRERHPNAKILALVSSPREYEISGLERYDIRVLAQPYRLRDLFSIFGPSSEFLASSAA